MYAVNQGCMLEVEFGRHVAPYACNQEHTASCKNHEKIYTGFFFFPIWVHSFFFNKNKVNKNIEAEIAQKIRTI